MYLNRNLKDMKILLIDDDEWIRDSLSLFFEEEECHLKALETAEDGLKELRQQDYHIVIADYLLPGMDGLEFLEQIKSSHPSLLTILVTAYGSKDLRLKASKIGIDGFINKPFTLKTLEEALSCLVEERKDL